MNREITFGDNEIIVSKMDIKGRISYVNRVFMRVANYPEHELLGREHNVIFHPDMPSGLVSLMWDTLEQGREFLGYIKCLSSDGGFFWVFVDVTPDWGLDDNLVGYHYVGRSPKAAGIKAIEPLYREMLGLEQSPQVGVNLKEASIELLMKKLAASDTTYDEFVLSL